MSFFDLSDTQRNTVYRYLAILLLVVIQSAWKKIRGVRDEPYRKPDPLPGWRPDEDDELQWEVVNIHDDEFNAIRTIEKS